MGFAGTTTSSLHKKCLKKQQIQGHPFGIHQFALLNGNSQKKTYSFVNFTNDILKIDFLENDLTDLSTSILCKIYLIVFLTGILVKSDSTS